VADNAVDHLVARARLGQFPDQRVGRLSWSAKNAANVQESAEYVACLRGAATNRARVRRSSGDSAGSRKRFADLVEQH
jgi:hypothetical protein